jgi:hypothetical protein
MTMDHKTGHAQSIIEFTVGMVVVSLFIFSMVQVFRWGMMDMAERRWENDHVLLNSTNVYKQLKPNFHRTRPMDALWRQQP